ncbi:MAG: winged helix-turn-helix domain-containing protein [Candidatus Shapirobacteria bacterium]|jgi:DNA-binding winged helix-turn-helix (wHTH) protein
MPKGKRKLDHILTDATEKEIFGGNILESLIREEAATVVFVPHAGRSKAIKYIADKSKEIGFERLGNYKIVLIDWEKMMSTNPGEIFKIMVSELEIEELGGEDYLKIFNNLEKKIVKLVGEGIHLIFIFKQWERAEYPIQFFNNLVYLWRLDKTRIHYVFASNQSLVVDDKLNKYGKLAELVCANIVYYPLFGGDDREVVIQELAGKYKYVASNKQKDIISRISGGHPFLIKLGLRESVWLKDDSEAKWYKFFAESWEINKAFKDIWEVMPADDKRTVGQVANGEAISYGKVSEYLKGLRLVNEAAGKAVLFSEAFGNFLRNRKIEGGNELSVNQESGEIAVNGERVSDNFSLTEHKLLIFLIGVKNQVVTREKVAEILWGKDSYEKYSDWAMDKALYNLRKKLEKIGCRDKLQAIRRRGYRLIN